MNDAPKGPLRIEIDDLPEIDAGVPVGALEEERLAQVARVTRRSGRLARWFWRALGALVALALSVWAWDFASGLADRSPVLGGLAWALILAALAILLAMALREWAAVARLSRLDRLRAGVETARDTGDAAAAARAVDGVARLYAGRGDAAWGLQRLSELRGDALDAETLLALAEREVLGPLDAAARAEVEAAAARVATLTALVPIPMVDVAAALWSNLAMIRGITAVYGGRAGTLGSWRLVRAVIGHLAATGAVAVGDDLIGSALGGGLAGKLSRRFGEGVINGALTVRVGVAAMEMCRPMPFAAVPRPGRAALLRRALTGVFRST